MAETRFDRDQFAEAYPPGIERSWWHVARNSIISRTLAKHIPRQVDLLEIGCGTGVVTCYLREKKWKVTGVDLGEPRQGIRCPQHLLLGQDATRLPEEHRLAVGALLLFDVIEHIQDAPTFLQGILAAFPNAGHVVVCVPARSELWTTFDDHFGHFRRYDHPMLQEEFARAGLRMVSSAYFFHALYGAIGLNNLLRGRKRNIVLNAPAPGLATSMNGFIGRLFSAEAALLPGALVGSSIIAVGQRSAHPHS